MLLKLYYSKQFSKDTITYGCNLDEVFELLGKLRKNKVNYELINTDVLTEEMITSAYVEAILPSVLKKYRVRQVFGSRRHSGWLFGKQVPALVVYNEKTRYPIDVYPHEVGLKKIEIVDFLRGLKK